MADRQEKLPPFQTPRPRPPLIPLPLTFGFNRQVPESPLFSSKPFKDVLADSPFCTMSRELLLQMRSLTEQALSDKDVQDSTISSLSLPPLSSSSLSRVIYFTSIIYLRTLGGPPIPFSSPLNSTAIKEVSLGLEDTDNDKTWIQYPGILLWVVLIAASSTIATEQGGFFIMLLFRVGTSAIWWGTEEAREAILKFAEVKGRANGLSMLRKI